MKMRVLLIGLNPQNFDYAHSQFAGHTPETVMAGLNADLAALKAEGYEAEMALVDPDESAIPTIITALNKGFDCVLLGAALRTTPDYFPIFERVVNLVHAGAPRAKICFNTGPNDSLAAVKRWIG